MAGSNGVVLDESNRTGVMREEYIYFNGARVARRNMVQDVHCNFSDPLGSASVITVAPATSRSRWTFTTIAAWAPQETTKS